MFLRIEPAKSLYLYLYCIYIWKYEMTNSWLVPLARVNQILAAMGEQVFFTGDVMRHVCRIGRFPCINIKPILALLWKADRESHHVVVGDWMRDVFGQPFFLDAIFVQRRHEVGQRSRHSKLDFQLAASEHQCLLMDRKDVKEVSYNNVSDISIFNNRKRKEIYMKPVNFELALLKNTEDKNT